MVGEVYCRCSDDDGETLCFMVSSSLETSPVLCYLIFSRKTPGPLAVLYQNILDKLMVSMSPSLPKVL
jgi:hypothetical protein